MAKRLLIAAVVAIFGCSYTASAQTNSLGAGRGLTEAARRTSGGLLSKSLSAADLLRKRVKKVEWTDATLDEVLDWLDDQGDEQLNILPKWQALSVEEVDPDSLVTIRLRRTTVAAVLTEVLEQLSEEGEVIFRAQEGTLTIATKEYFGRVLPTRVYEVTDLVFEIPDFGRSFPSVDMQAASRSSGGGGGGKSGRSIFRGSGGQSSTELQQEETDLKERIQNLIDRIKEHVEPESWRDDSGGGGRGRISTFSFRNLIVTNTVEVHEKLAGHFSQAQ